MDTRFHGVEAMAAHAVLQKMTIRRTAAQMKIEGRFCLCAFAHPHIAGEFRIPRIRRRFSGKQRLPRENLAQGSVVKIYICPVYRLGSIIVVPVAGNQIRKRIILTQYVVGDNGFPDAAAAFFPLWQHFCPGNHTLPRYFGAVDNPVFFAAAAQRVYILPINAGSNQHFIPRHGSVCRLLNG